MKQLVYFVLVMTLFLSCKKPNQRKCFKSEGESIFKEINLPSFDHLLLKENIEFVLIQDTIEKIIIEGGENLVDFISATVDNNVLKIENLNKCNFLRYNSSKIKVHIHFKTLFELQFEGTESLICKDTLNLSWFSLFVRDGGGSVDLLLNASHLYSTISNGYGDFTISGNVNNADLYFQTTGYGDTYGLNVQDTLSIISYTPSVCKVNSEASFLKADIRGMGDIWYKGVPDSINLIKTGTGNLIFKN